MRNQNLQNSNTNKGNTATKKYVKSGSISGKVHTKTTSGKAGIPSDESRKSDYKMKMSVSKSGIKRVKRIYETDRHKRVMSPIEAERRSRMLYGNVSASFHMQAQRSKRLKARRTLAHVPAPKPLSVNTSGTLGFGQRLKNAIVSHFRKIDFVLLLFIAIVGIIGVIAVHSGSMTDPFHRRIDFLQMFCFAAGILAVLLLPLVDLSGVLTKWKWIYAANVILLLITLVFGYSPTGEENNSWINLGFTSIQPAEFSKVLFILSLSAHLEKVRERINSLPELFSVLLHGVSVIGLVLAEKDWGNTLVFIVIFIAMIFCAKIDWRYILGTIIVVIAAFPIVWENLGEFRKKRVLIGFNPELDPQGYGHQVIRSRNAIASGGLFGQGYLNGETIQRPGALFAQHTDMVFAVVGQEFGFVGCAVLILAYAFLVVRVLTIAGKSGDYAGTYICCGVAGMLIFQFVINIGMALGITPVVGITLPLVSYGASSLICMYASLALVMTVYAGSKNYSYKSI